MGGQEYRGGSKEVGGWKLEVVLYAAAAEGHGDVDSIDGNVFAVGITVPFRNP